MGVLTNITSRAVRLYDETLLHVAPKRYQMRRHWQLMESNPDYRSAVDVLMRQRGYRAAGESGSKTPWGGSTRSADGEILNDLPALRTRSRELNRDDSLGSGITRTFVNNWIGTGMVPQANTGNVDKNKAIESVWSERKDSLSPVDNLTHGAGQRLIARKVLEDGDVLRKPVYSPDEHVWFETVEAERLATPIDRTNDLKMRHGVERREDGRVAAYWVSKHHPGDSASILSLGSENFTRIEAQYARHLKITDRPGQTRGVPLFHVILQDIRDLDLLMVASLKRTQIAACLSIFIRSAADTSDILDVTAAKYGYKLDQAIEPGMIFKLFPGEQIETLVPNFPTPELAPFIIMIARRIGAALGVCWQMILKDFSESTYSSARTDLLESRQTFKVLQAWFIEAYLNWEWQIVLMDAWLRGDERLAGVTADELAMVNWTPNGWDWVDPLKEAKAAETELKIGSKTLRDICGAKGAYWEDQMRQKLMEEKRLREMRKELGLPSLEEIAALENPKAAPAPEAKEEDEDDDK